MGEFSRWLLRDEQKGLFDYLFALTLNVVFLALAALLLWPSGKASMALRLAKGYWLFWIVIQLTAVLVILFRKIFRVEMDTHFDAYLISALVVSGLVQAGWSAFAALTVRSLTDGTPVWLASLLYLFGLLSCYVAFNIVSAFYQGSLYRLINLSLALVGFILFSVWPTAARVAYGWFFDLF